MAYIYGVMVEEYGRLKEKKDDFEMKMQALPKGSIVQKKINGKSYSYLMYKENGKVKTEYVKQDCLEELQKQIERRKRLQSDIKSINADMKILEKVVKKDEYGKQ